MSIKRYKFLTSILLVLPLFLFFVSSPVLAAGSMYLSPGSRIVGTGSTFSVAVRENSGGDAVNAVTANLSYPSDKIDFVGISTGGSGFNIDAPSSGGGGSVSINRGIIGSGVTGDKLIATVTFRAKATYTGPVTISVVGGSSLIRGSDQANVIGGMAGATYTVSKNVPTAAPIPGPQITNIQVTDVSYKTATIAWTTDVASTSQVEYGLNEKYGLSVDDTKLTKAHSVVLSSELLTPGTTYHFHVISANSSKNESTSPDATFRTKGYNIMLAVTDENGKPITNSTVLLDTQSSTLTSTSDSNGQVTFTDVPPGKLLVTVDRNGEKQSDIINVQESTQPQNFTVQVKGMSKSPLVSSPLAIAMAIVGVVFFLLVLSVLFTRSRKPDDFPPMSSGSSSSNSSKADSITYTS